MTARRALNQCDNSVTSDQNWPKQMLFHNVAARMWLGIQAFSTCRVQIPPLSPCRVHVWHCPGAPRTSLDPLRAVGAVQVGAAVGAEVVAGLYVDHRVSAHGTLFFLACGHPPCSGSASYYSYWQARYPWQRPSAHARACARVAACLPGSRTRAIATTPGSGGTKIFTN